MNVCRNCGKPLEDEEELCPSCRAVESARPRPGRAPRARKRRMNRTTRKMLIIAGVLAVVFAVLCTVSTVLYSRYNPEKFAASVDAALAAGDAKALSALLTGEDIAVSDEGAAALCRAFTGEEQRAALRGQLLAQALDETAPGAYPALSVAKERVFLGYARCTLSVHSVQLLVSTDAQNIQLTVDGVPRTGEAVAEGVLYKNLFPGLYTCALTGTTAAGQAVQGDATDLPLFGAESPTVWSGALPIADITVSGCTSDDALIAVDGVNVEQRPVNGAVSLPQVAVGSTITMRYTAPHGAVTTASVQFTDKNQTALAFENHVTEGGVPSAAELDSLLSAYYASYLDALNRQDASLITGCTDAFKAGAAAGVVSEAHKANAYVLDTAACSPGAIKPSSPDGVPTVSCYARFRYIYTNRESHEESEATLYRVCSFVWADGWKLNTMADSSEEAFAAAAVDALP